MKQLTKLFVWTVGPAAAETASAQTGSQPTFWLDRVGLLQQAVGGYPLWQYFASLVWVILAFVVAQVVDWVMTHQLRRVAARTKTELDDRLIGILHKPVKLAIFLVMLNAGIGMFQWPDWVEKALAVLFVLAVAGTIIYLAIRLLDLLLEFVQQRFYADDAQLAKLMLPVLGKSLKVFVIIIGVLTTAQHLGMPITSVLAGLGVGGIAVALAAQNTLANVFGSITILTDRPFRVGDRIQIDKYDGMVETIGLRSTRIRTLEGHLVVIPNKTMADSAINNVSLRPNIRQLMTISLVYGTTPAKMQQAVAILRDIFQKHPLTHDALVYWKDYGPHSLDIFVVYWCKTKDFKVFLQAMEEINLEIKRQFDAAGLDFAFPTQTVHLQQATPAPAPGQTTA
jgi:MscS family membrane protein